jgi:ABC-type glutathione transport system ATPase component
MKEKLNELYFRSLVDSEREEAPTPRAHDLRKLKAEAKGLSFHYGEVAALKAVDLPVAEHRVTALIGPSGCGKSTFLRAVNRMREPVRGGDPLLPG